MTTIRAMPILEVAEIARSVSFYESLGFESHGIWGDPGAFCIVQRGDVTLGLNVNRQNTPHRNAWWSAYIYVSDADALHAEMKAAGAEVSAPENREYGLREFDLIDVDGHRLAFGADIAPGACGPGLGAGRGRG